MGDPTWTMNIQRSCPVLYFHFFWGIALVILGWTAFAARWIPAIKCYHRKLGQIWVYGMIIQIYSSTYVSYNGFRWFIFMFGVICYFSLIFAHSMIRKFQLNIRNKKQNGLLMATQLKYIGNNTNDNNDTTPIHTEKEEEFENNNNGYQNIADNEDTESSINSTHSNNSWFTQKTLKTLHGIFMILSLIMLTGAGAAFTTRFAQAQECKNIYCEHRGNDGWLPTCFVDGEE